MAVNAFTKIGISLGAAALLAGAVASPALADPPLDGEAATYGELVGLGSDTTQDVVNGLALAIGGGALASYDAVGSTTVVTRDGGVEIPRANGSGAGRDLLRVAIGQTTSATVATPVGTASVTAANSVGQIDFARSSGGPAANVTTGAGVLAYVPFARDAVTVAVDEGSPLAVVPWILGDSSTAGSSTPSLYNVYRGNVKYAYLSGTEGSYAYVGVGATDEAPEGATAFEIQALLPKSGSGTRSYFIGKVGLTETDITSLPAGTIMSTYNGGTDVQEHDGSALVDDPTAIVPFSIAQWVAQANGAGGVSDRRHGAEALALNGTAPTLEDGGVYSTNPAFSAMVRDVYNIVPTRYLDDATTPEAAMFAGTGSAVCEATDTITEFGFQLMPGASGSTSCGYTGLRAYTGSSSTVSLSLASDAVEVGGSITATVTPTSTHAMGGTVYIVDADDAELASVEVAAGETATEVEVPFDSVGDIDVHAEFVPALPGIAGSVSASEEITVAGQSTETALSVAGLRQVGATLAVVGWVTGADPEGGVLQLRDGGTLLGEFDVQPGENGGFLSFVATKAAYELELSYVPPAGSTYVGSSATRELEIAAGDATITVGKIASVSAKKQAKATVTVTGVPGAVPSGTITVTEGAKTLVASKTLGASGKVTITLPKLKKGKHTLTFTYNGDALWNGVSTTAKVTIS